MTLGRTTADGSTEGSGRKGAKRPGTCRAIQVARPFGGFELVTREVPIPAALHVRIKVEACGICHSDAFTRQGTLPAIQYPRVPGHEVIGRIDALGPGMIDWTEGQRVGVGWFGGNCGLCEPCRRGQFMQCQVLRIPGVTHDGGYAEFMLAHQSALVRIPGDLASAEGAPLLCAGVTTFNGLRNSPARAGDVVAIIGIGGLGHLAVQFAVRMGFVVAAVGRGRDKERLARTLGAHHYVDSATENVAEALQRIGGAALVLATAPSASAVTAAIDGLCVGGQLIVAGPTKEPIAADSFQLIGGARSLRGTAAGTSIDSEDAVKFSTMFGVRPMIERLPLERAAEGYERMISGRARFRVVLTNAG